MPTRPLLALFVLAVAASPAMAANARHPYRNVDPRVDGGNDTGDAYVGELNRQQLGRSDYGYGRVSQPFDAPPPYAPAPGLYPPAPYGSPPPYWR